MHHEERNDGIEEVVRRALSEELNKALDSAMLRLAAHSETQSKLPEMLSRKQAANVLGVSIQTVAALINDGVLESVKIRRRVLIPFRSVIAYLERGSTPSAIGGR